MVGQVKVEIQNGAKFFLDLPGVDPHGEAFSVIHQHSDLGLDPRQCPPDQPILSNYSPSNSSDALLYRLVTETGCYPGY